MKVVSCNLYIEYHRGDRSKGQEKLLLSLDPDVILLQEVGCTMIFPGYTIACETKDSEMICQIYVKNCYEVEEVFSKKFNKTCMQRGMCGVKIKNIWYVTTHLESMPQYENIRTEQLKEFFDLNLHQFVLGMDSNMEGEIYPPTYSPNDIWGKDPVPTWYARRFFGFDKTARYDRFFIQGVNEKAKEVVHNEFSDHDILYLNIA